MYTSRRGSHLAIAAISLCISAMDVNSLAISWYYLAMASQWATIVCMFGPTA
jgi:hypothetical protein